jgi:hypothetical protein
MSRQSLFPLTPEGDSALRMSIQMQRPEPKLHLEFLG